MSRSEYVTYYESQQRGSGAGPTDLRVFKGGIQSGSGLGDMIPALLSFIAPAATRGLAHFAGHTIAGKIQGKTIKDAATAALGPGLSAAGTTLIPQIYQQFANAALPTIVPRPVPEVRHPVEEAGIGVHPGTDIPYEREADVRAQAKMKGSGVLFAGVDGVPETAPGYKRPPKKSAKKRARVTKAAAGPVRYNF